MSSSAIHIHTLPALRSATEGSSSLLEEIEEGLIGTSEACIPGETKEDQKWAFKRSVPTVVLYDEVGLRLYDKITSHAPEYYLFPDELNLLKNYGDEIAKSMGFPGRTSSEEEYLTEKESEQEKKKFQQDSDIPPIKPWKPARWGDADVGKWNNGVNGEEGLGGGWDRGYDVVELGAGALRKTAHLLTALSSALPPPLRNASELPAPITYHPLDLSRPELHRVLGEMNEAFGDRLKGKVECIGLHGDYTAGLQFIREGKLESLRASLQVTSNEDESIRGRALEVDDAPGTARSESNSTESSGPATPPDIRIHKNLEISPSITPPVSATGTSILTPGPAEMSPLPSSMTDDTTSSEAGTGTWSPIESEIKSLEITEHLENVSTSKAGNRAKTDRPLHLVFLGSSLGNFERSSAAPFLKSLPLRKGDTLLLGLDGRPSPGIEGSEKVRIAYNDPKGYTKAFEEHGWDVVLSELGIKEEENKGVEFVGRYNEILGRHESYFRSKAKQTLHLPRSNQDVVLEEDELLNIEWSYKYSKGEAIHLFQQSDLRIINSWKAPNSEYHLYLLERPEIRFKEPNHQQHHLSDKMDMQNNLSPVQGELVGIKSIPTWSEWQGLWKLWDHITLEMIPKEMLHSKPIDLRHICLFYLGHIPTFLDIHLTRMTGGHHTEPEHFKDIFERGIDPDVDDPSKIHSHSEVPEREDDWPSLDEILAFRDRVRHRLRTIYEQLSKGEMKLTRHVGRVLFMTFEHEAEHAETLLYMLIQSPTTRAPTSIAKPSWDVLARQWNEEYIPNQVLTIQGGQITIGHDDLEAQDVDFVDGKKGWENHEFGWDNEHPKHIVPVKTFKIDSLPISNTDYLLYLENKANGDIKAFNGFDFPANWIKVDNDNNWKIRTLYGPVGFDVAGKWPLMASKDEIEGYVKYKGGRLPSEEELRLFWNSPEGARPAGDTANIGVKNWHPIPPRPTIQDHAGETIYGHNGGVWEWTSTNFDGYKDFVPSKIYPGYSADFFDGKHFVVLGGSYATIPQIAGRNSFRNWYQGNYRFSFIGARVAYDV